MITMFSSKYWKLSTKRTTMFSTIQLYIIVGLMIIIAILGGGWYYQNNIKSAEIATLTERNSRYEMVIEQQSKTIDQMVADAKREAETKQAMIRQIVKTEMDFVDEWSAINELDISSEAAIADAETLERKVNEEFQKSVDSLKASSGSKPDSGVGIVPK